MEPLQADVLQLEREAVPVHFPGMVAHWPAVRLWQGDSGLQRLIQLAGGARVEAMVTSAADGRATGDMQHLVLLACTLADFLDGSLERQLMEHQPPSAGAVRLYLAQSPLCTAARAGGGTVSAGSGSGGGYAGTATLQPAALQPLMEDLGVPLLAQQVQLSQVNFWASSRATRSSLHYDPYQNLLCVVRGSKKVWLAPPSCTPHLSSQPLTHESANHSPADLAQPDLRRFPGLAAALGKLRVYELAVGDVLYIPEGWWHQVDSRDGTLAVNFWWEGVVSRQLGGHMDRYYLRRLMQSLVEQQKQAALAALPRCDLLALDDALAAAPTSPTSQQPKEVGQQLVAAANDWRQQPPQRWEQPPDVDAEAAALPAASSDVGGPSPATGTQMREQQAALRMLAAAVAEHQQAGPGSAPPAAVIRIVATLAAHSAQMLLDVLLQLRRRQPQLALHLLLHSLGAAGWELLSGCMERRQEELAAEGTGASAEEAVGAACDALYSAVEDRQQLLSVILRCKESFAQQALRAVLDTELARCL